MLPDKELNELVKKAKKYDEVAFGELYKHYFRKVYSFIYYKVSNVTAAEDLTGKVFLKALDKISTLNSDGKSFLPWILRIASNSTTDYFRAKGKSDKIFINNGDSMETQLLNVPSKDNPEEMVLNGIEFGKVKEAISQLTKDQQQVILLKFMSGLTNAQVGEILNKKEGAVKALTFRALNSLNRILGDDEQKI